MKLYLDIDNTKKSGIKTSEFSEVDIAKEDKISLTHTFESLISPVDFVSEFSYEIKIPRTKKNNKLFDHFYRLDNYISDNSYNPNEKLRYYLLSDHNDVISRGVAYLNYVDEQAYHFNLLGSLNDIFTRFLNAGWSSEKASEDDEYYQIVDYLKYNGQNYSDTPKLNRDVVFASWEIQPSERIFDINELRSKYNSLAGRHVNLTNKNVFISNFIGFAPTNQGRYPKFESGKWFKNINGRNQLVNVLCSDSTSEYELVGDGLTESQIGEFRSYFQQPYVYVYRLMQIFQEESRAISGYDLRFDPAWYNENDYYNNIVYMLPTLFSDANETILSNDVVNYQNETKMPSFNSYELADNKVADLNTFQTKYESPFKRLNLNNYTYSANIEINLRMDSERTVAPLGIKYNYQNPILVLGYLSDGANTLVQKMIVVIPLSDEKDENGNYVDTLLNTIGQDAIDRYMLFADEVVETRYSTYKSGHDFILGNIDFSIDYISDGTKSVKFGYVSNFGNNISPFSNESGQAMNGSFTFNYLQYGRWYLNLKSTNYFTEKTDGRSNQNLTMENLFKNITPFEIILKFCKLTAKLFVVDDFNKTITIWDRENYFKNIIENNINAKVPPTGDVSYQGVYDITKLVDRSKGFKLSAPSWNDKFLLFNYKDLENADYFSDYRKKYGLNYGEKKVVTSNEKNNNVHELFKSKYDEINPSMIASEFILKVKDIKAGDADLRIENYPQIVNSQNGESANIWNNFYFRNPNGAFDLSIGEGWRSDYVLITDDIAEEKSGTYAWHSDEQNSIRAFHRPRFNTHSWNDEVSIQFAPTREIYHQFEYLPTTQYLYDRFFRNYIEQIYNYQSKKVELYANISSLLYRRLKANPLVQIDNSLCIVTKIEDWYEGRESTKIIVVKLQDLNQLTNYQLDVPQLDLLAFDSDEVMMFDNNDKILAN